MKTTATMALVDKNSTNIEYHKSEAAYVPLHWGLTSGISGCGFLQRTLVWLNTILANKRL